MRCADHWRGHGKSLGRRCIALPEDDPQGAAGLRDRGIGFSPSIPVCTDQSAHRELREACAARRNGIVRSRLAYAASAPGGAVGWGREVLAGSVGPVGRGP